MIKGTNNEFILHFPDGKTEYLSEMTDSKWTSIVGKANVEIDGDNNQVVMSFTSEEEAEALLTHPGFNVMIYGNNNRISIGSLLTVGYNPAWNMLGMHLVIGTPIDNWVAPGTSRRADNCWLEIGEHVNICGAMIYLQEDNSHITIGRDTMISWGVNIWCTDAHTVGDLEGNPCNYGKFIEIGNHVWVGKDVKIGKNVRIGNNNVIGWGSIVTKSVEASNQIIAGVPAKVVKEGITWDGRTVNEYQNYIQR